MAVLCIIPRNHQTMRITICILVPVVAVFLTWNYFCPFSGYFFRQMKWDPKPAEERMLHVSLHSQGGPGWHGKGSDFQREMWLRILSHLNKSKQGVGEKNTGHCK